MVKYGQFNYLVHFNIPIEIIIIFLLVGVISKVLQNVLIPRMISKAMIFFT